MKRWQVGLLCGSLAAIASGAIVGGSIAIAQKVQSDKEFNEALNCAREQAKVCIDQAYIGALKRSPTSKDVIYPLAKWAIESLQRATNPGAAESVGKITAAGLDASGEVTLHADYFVELTKELVECAIQYDGVNKPGFGIACQGYIGAAKRCAVNDRFEHCEKLYNTAFKKVVYPCLSKATELNSEPLGALCAAYFDAYGEIYTVCEQYTDLMGNLLPFLNQPTHAQNIGVGMISNAVLGNFKRYPDQSAIDLKAVAHFWINKIIGQKDGVAQCIGSLGACYSVDYRFVKDINEYNRATFEFALPYAYKVNDYTWEECSSVINYVVIKTRDYPQNTDLYIQRGTFMLDMYLSWEGK